MNDQRETGEKFLRWIERQGVAAVSARLTRQALALSKQQQSAPPVQKCGVCGKGGHKTEGCAGDEGKGKLWEPNRDQRASLEQDIAGNAFAASGRTYPSGQGIETFLREEWRQKMGKEKGAQELRVKAEANIGSCRVCKGRHEYQRRLPWGSLPWPSDRLQSCKNFQAMNPQQRAGVIQEQGGCVVCLSWGHNKLRCNMVQYHNEGGPGIGSKERGGAGVCGQLHHRMLHGSSSAHGSTNAVMGLPREQEGFRQDWSS